MCFGSSRFAENYKIFYGNFIKQRKFYCEPPTANREPRTAGGGGEDIALDCEDSTAEIKAIGCNFVGCALSFWQVNGSVTIKDCKFSGEIRGNAVYYERSLGPLVIDGCTYYTHSAVDYADSDGPFSATNCTFLPGEFGSGIFYDNSCISPGDFVMKNLKLLKTFPYFAYRGARGFFCPSANFS